MRFLFFLLLSFSVCILADDGSEIFVRNRVLAQVNGKTITALDVMKRLDYLFYRQYPDYVSSKEARFQFYEANWKYILQDLIEKELIQADASDIGMNIDNSEVRRELENTFGPDIIANLDRLGLTLDEAMEMLKTDLIIKRMMMYKVNGKAFRSISPQDVKRAYGEWSLNHSQPEKWSYRFITLRGEKAESVVHEIESLIQEGVSWSEISAEASSRGFLPETVSLTVSDVYTHSSEELPQAFKPVVQSLEIGQVGGPIVQESRRNGEPVVRFLALENKTASIKPPLKDVEMGLKNQLIQKEIDEEAKRYLSSLKNTYSVSLDPQASSLDELPIPFSLTER